MRFRHAGAAPAQTASSPQVRKRCAFDIGSGETKVTAAEVLSAEAASGIAKLLAKKILLPFVKKFQDGVIPDYFIEEAVAKINTLKSECAAVGAQQYSGVATSGFRLARNGQRALAKISQETNIPLRIITGDQEAVLGFLVAATTLQADGRNLVVWDIGGGSMQFSMSADSSSAAHPEYVISSDHIGVELFRREIAKHLERSAAPVNPLTREEMTRAIELGKQLSRAVNPKILERLRRGDMRVAGLGGVHTESLAGQAGTETKPPFTVYTIEGVRAAAERAADKSDQYFRKAYPENKYPESQATNLALILGYMEGLGIKEVIPLEVYLSDGLLVDATYWPREKLR